MATPGTGSRESVQNLAGVLGYQPREPRTLTGGQRVSESIGGYRYDPRTDVRLAPACGCVLRVPRLIFLVSAQES